MTLTKRRAPSTRDWWWSQARYHVREIRGRARAHARTQAARRGEPIEVSAYALDVVRALRALLEAWR